jgi:putative tryptophan/tyrosine transport system substrate-binding protein
VEGQNITLEYRYAQGREDVLPVLAADLVRLPVDVILTWGTPPARAAQHATSSIPIVIGAIGDPVRAGVVASLARPGGNVTGLTSNAVELEEKRLEWLKALVPQASQVAVLWNPANPFSALALEQA